MPEKIVPPYSNADIVNIIKAAILNGTIATEKQLLDPAETYTLKVVKGKIVLVEDSD